MDARRFVLCRPIGAKNASRLCSPHRRRRTATPRSLCHHDSGRRARNSTLALPRFSARRNLGVIVRAGAMRLSHRCTEGFTAAMLHDGRVHSRARVRPGATS
ncbi:hypothetical protein FPL06_08655 [Xanthomonas citri pv. glycines]|nr:hypothetical protein BHE84_24335 [Xanthomonas citri pv. glycines str. 8ra]PNV30019.1 hypothetical protein xavtCFBP7764_05745 [Xanthomonas citri]QDR46208.1 hypothetical protein FPK90_17285 [Xanthomonas citri pv. glycines]QDS08198.1 hypothetical protein FPL00_16180 [Xanthomonas citri pv. glycines]QDS12543.1 hypothetical protein FPL03_16525 [Xanthomonas citri pv. glycines]